MAITVANIITRVKQITRRTSLTTLGTSNDHIYKALLKISEMTRSLKTSISGTFSNGDTHISKPHELHPEMVGEQIDGLVVNDVPLDALAWREYLGGKLKGYCVQGSNIYVRPTAAGGESYVLYYARKANSGDDMTIIPFSDEYQPAIEYFAAAKVYEDYELFDRQKEMLAKFFSEMKDQLDKMPPAVCQARAYTGIRS